MRPQTKSTQVTNPLSSCTAVGCPAQVLVIDRLNGPADILMHTISLLLGREVSVTLVADHADVLRALNYFYFDLVVVGLEENRSIQLTVLPHIHVQDSEVPVIVVGWSLPRLYQQYARHYGACEVLNVPERSADLKALVLSMARRYLQVAPCQTHLTCVV
jgi:DNA-binding NtrC family response regulator